MSRKRLVIFGLAAVFVVGVIVAVVRPHGRDPKAVAVDLQAAVRKSNGDVLRHVVCVRHGEGFRCVGDYTPSLASVKAQVRAVDTTQWTAKDWRAIQDANSGRLAYDAT